MRKIRITLPATATDLGPALHSLGLALGLYCTVEMIERPDEALVVETEGEGAGRYPIGLRHPVVLGLMRLFQKQERAPLGLTVRINNSIPADSGLGAEAAFWTAGLIGANNLLGNPYSRSQILEFAAAYTRRPDNVVTALLGGLTTSLLDVDGALLYRSLPTTGLTLILALPEIPDYADETAQVRPERAPMTDALHNLSRAPLLIEALRDGDLKLTARLLDDHLHAPYLRRFIPGYGHATEMAQRSGALAATLCGGGPAILIFAESNHKRIATALEVAFENAGIKARTWVLPVDTQGVVISAAMSS